MKKLVCYGLATGLLLSGCSQQTLDHRLGGSMESFEEAYGPSKDLEEDALFNFVTEDEKIHALFAEDHAMMITIDLTQEDKDFTYTEEVINYVQSFIPEDSNLENDPDEELLDVYVYSSSQLASEVGDGEADEEFFSVLLSMDDDGIYNAVAIQPEDIGGEE